MKEWPDIRSTTLRLKLAVIGLLAVAATGPLQQAGAQLPDSGYATLLRQLLVDSLRGAGHRAGEIYFPSDSTTGALLRRAGTFTVAAREIPDGLGCPSLRLSPAEESPVGYGVTIGDSVGADPAIRWLQVRVSCTYASAGRPGGIFPFSEWGTWEVRRTDAGWRVVRVVIHAIT